MHRDVTAASRILGRTSHSNQNSCRKRDGHERPSHGLYDILPLGPARRPLKLGYGGASNERIGCDADRKWEGKEAARLQSKIN